MTPRRVLLALFALSSITYLDRVAISTLGPVMMKDLSLNAREWGWVMGIFSLSYGLFEYPSGVRGDRVGPRSTLAVIVAFWSLFTFLTGLVQGFVTLLVCRFCFGAGEAGAYPNSSIVIGRWFTREQRGQAQALLWTASRLGGALSPLVLTTALEPFGWRVAFFVVAVPGVIWAIAWYFTYPARDRETEQPRFDLNILAHLGAGRVAAIAGMYFCFCFASGFFVSWMPTYLDRVHAIASSQKWLLALPFLGGAAGTLAGGRLSDHLVRTGRGLTVARTTISIIGLVVASGAMIGLAKARGAVACVAWATLGFGASDMMLPVAWTLCIDVAPNRAGALSATMNTAGQLGGFLSSVLFAYIAEWAGDVHAPLFVMAGSLLLSAVLWRIIDVDAYARCVSDKESR